MSAAAIDGELLEVFLPEAREYLATIAGPGDPAARGQAAHGLRGACAMVGLDELALLAQELEDQVRAGADAASLCDDFGRRLDQLATGTPAGAAGPPPEPEWDADELRDLRAFFLEEAHEHLAAIGQCLAALRADGGDAAALAEILRKLHTFKGSAGSVKLPELGQRAHHLEDQVIALRDRHRALGAEERLGLEEEVERLSAAVHQVGRSLDRAAAGGEAAPDERRQPRDRRLGERRLDAEAHTIRVAVERIEELMDAASEVVFDRTRMTRRLQELEGCLRDLIKVHGALGGALNDRAALRAAPELELRLGEIFTELGDVLTSLRRAVEGAADDAEGLRRTSATLQEGIRRVRMMAVGRLFARLEHPVRELARKEGKQVVLHVEGEETEVDKAVVERIAEPLLHLVRNAVAHGIEPPELRRARGKPPAGAITLSARHEGDAVEITVADDGQGIDLQAVRHALVGAGRVDARQADGLDDERLFAALFEPGVSTRLAADDLAGRGVGLDAVREAIGRLGGTVRVESTPGRGAMFLVRLPVTTAVQEALLFKVGGQVYAVPAARVEEAVLVEASDVVRGGDAAERVRLRGQKGERELLLVRLGALLGHPAPPGARQQRTALVVAHRDQPFAITCDKVIGPREIVVRSLGPLLSELPLFSGATISGAGKVQLLLDLEALAEHARRGVEGRRPSRAIGPRRVLVVDDSRSIREAASLVLQQGGFSVEAANDGWDAWELLQDRPFDLLVTDLEMPRLDGDELIQKVRRSSDLAQLPIVVLTSRTSDAARARVLAAGADAFVPKPVHKKQLLEAVEAALHK